MFVYLIVFKFQFLTFIPQYHCIIFMLKNVLFMLFSYIGKRNLQIQQKYALSINRKKKFASTTKVKQEVMLGLINLSPFGQVFANKLKQFMVEMIFFPKMSIH